MEGDEALDGGDDGSVEEGCAAGEEPVIVVLSLPLSPCAVGGKTLADALLLRLLSSAPEQDG